MQNILICDDERDIVSALRIYLTGQGYDVTEAYDGDGAIRAVEGGGIDLVLLDVMMPVTDGISAMVSIRRISDVPIILLTAKSENSDVIFGLDMGADDYITKPFVPGEVIARVRSQLRRYSRFGGSAKPDETLTAGGLTLDAARHEVTLDGEPVTLTPTEFDILRMLMESPGRVFSPAEIYRRVRGEEPLGAEGAIAVHIRHLREKLEIDASAPRYIKVVWGQGYRLDAPAPRTAP